MRQNQYIEKMTEELHTSLLYPKIGVAVFLSADEKTVHPFIFTTGGAAK